MKLFSNKKILALTIIVSCVASNAYATGKTYSKWYSSGCHSGGGSTGGGSTGGGSTGGGSTGGGSSTSTFCDSFENNFNYDIYEKSTGLKVDEGTDGSLSSVHVDGVGIQVSAWSQIDLDAPKEDLVKTATIKDYLNSEGTDKGLGVLNSYETNSGSGDYSHGVDNYSGHYTDYDMILLSFSEAVTLDGATFSWLGKGGVDKTQVSVAGLNDISGLVSGQQNWQDIANGSVASNSFQVINCETPYGSTYVSDFAAIGPAQYWLIGAYNTVFGDLGDDGSLGNDSFKLASVGFTKVPDTGTKPPTDVNAPSSFALLILGGGLMAWRRRKA
ncbi:exosortase-dependent surface protein XDP1 [Flavobacterium sp. W21_SRS_FM6]|uniref:exosortase-dependent surface protein XDP1 n=1 Tax=Flavobacterium sp. W21_SRS_FM6 TaxID=3240268 RepID=UPI003F901B43